MRISEGKLHRMTSVKATGEHAVRLRQNRSGLFVVFSAPFFDSYTSSFEDPVAPPETAANPLRLRLAVADAGPYYLPQEFVFDLPPPSHARGRKSLTGLVNQD